MSHLSEEQISAWIAGERSREVEDHLLTCSTCACEVERTAKALSLFRESGFQIADYWRRQPALARSHTEWALATVVIAIALIAIAVLRHPPASPVQPPQKAFIQIPYVVPPAPYERTSVVHMDVPVAALIAAGFPFDTTTASESIYTDVLLGQDGRALAIRFPENRND